MVHTTDSAGSAANKNIDIDLHTEKDAAPRPMDRFGPGPAECLLNLYINAIQAMETGGTLTVQCTAAGNGDVNITVQEYGLGIPADQLNKSSTASPPETGTGLGLAIVYR